MGASVQNIIASNKRTFVIHAKTDREIMLSRDGGMSWRAVAPNDQPEFQPINFKEWIKVSDKLSVRTNEADELVRTSDGGKTSVTCMKCWRIPRASSVFKTPWGIIASGPGGCYRSDDTEQWEELKLWREEETGAADFLHAYWMGRYYGFIEPPETNDSELTSILPRTVKPEGAAACNGPPRPPGNWEK
jgi:hypothetical protein